MIQRNRKEKLDKKIIIIKIAVRVLNCYFNGKAEDKSVVDTVLFDLDNTLLDFNKAEKIAVERTLREMGVTPDERMLKRYKRVESGPSGICWSRERYKISGESAALCESVPGVSYRR